MWHLRVNAIDSQARELNVLSLALSDEINRGLQGAEVGMHVMQLELAEGRLPTTGAEAEQALRIPAELMPLVRTLWLVNRDGRTLSASDKTPAPDLRSFSPALERLDDAIAVSRPFVDMSAQESLVAGGMPRPGARYRRLSLDIERNYFSPANLRCPYVKDWR